MSQKSFIPKRILVANRGEIACRIIKSIIKMGHQAIAIYSDADATALHVELAHEAYYLGPPPVTKSYLNVDRIIEICLEQKIDAVHPGYGFLSENTDFARRIENEGITFIGPNPTAIDQMGDKITSRTLAEQQKIPVVPGFSSESATLADYTKAAEKIGFPILLKASGGGGGKGIRILNSVAELKEQLPLVQSEAKKYFADDRVFLEKYITNPRHIEMQILGDKHGNIVHLGERECSIQRRYQKLIEETPSPFVTSEMRAKMATAALSLAKAIGYDSAGTIEFIVDENRSFYFLEMNTRLQVEHPVTEFVTGLDLVKEMIQVAFKEPLSFSQKDIQFKGHAIECRLIAEDPFQNFAPSTGLIKEFKIPPKENLRIDTGIVPGDRISVYYDSLISKVIAYGKSRLEAINCLIQSLEETVISGISTNLDFTTSILKHPKFQSGDISTHFIPTYFPQDQFTKPADDKIIEELSVIALWTYLQDNPFPGETDYMLYITNRKTPITLSLKSLETIKSNWQKGDSLWRGTIKNNPFNCRIQQDGHHFVFYHDSQKIEGIIYPSRFLPYLQNVPLKKNQESANIILAPMPGLILNVLVEQGQKVEIGQGILSMEAMKMENILKTTIAGTIEKIHVKQGDKVNQRDTLVVLSELTS